MRKNLLGVHLTTSLFHIVCSILRATSPAHKKTLCRTWMGNTGRWHTQDQDRPSLATCLVPARQAAKLRGFGNDCSPSWKSHNLKDEKRSVHLWEGPDPCLKRTEMKSSLRFGLDGSVQPTWKQRQMVPQEGRLWSRRLLLPWHR